ncbi:hypothetical protein CR513_41856, partial [Mucuna pruriens]
MYVPKFEVSLHGVVDMPMEDVRFINYINEYKIWMEIEFMDQKKTPKNKVDLVKRLVNLEY